MEEKTERQSGIRINKYLSAAGICSRREADREIAAGNVRIDGRAAAAGERVDVGMTVYFHGKPVVPEEEEILLAFHKPRGIVCTAEKREKNNIIDYINYPKRIYPVGRLDRDSEGLILLTNRGDLVNKIMRAGNFHEKEYLVTADRDLTDAFLEGMRGGVYLEELDVTTRKCRVKQTGKRTFSIVLTQGYNRQIRRMCETLGCRVIRLIRIRIMNVYLKNLALGTYRDLTEQEKSDLYRLIEHSRSAPAQKADAGHRSGR
ncbi:MAG: pseudouridine synthase [Lachnospiraceae bacterium]|nr:pseudouridine synthase [Lachnospiraceae bacterium]